MTEMSQRKKTALQEVARSAKRRGRKRRYSNYCMYLNKLFKIEKSTAFVEEIVASSEYDPTVQRKVSQNVLERRSLGSENLTWRWGNDKLSDAPTN